ncbi:hypothetical protein RhiirA4_482759 [Rhizophagus irregularis]|uniref:Uncharacterized protein n=1 Tax=Rhizophagus irregularis TaxID=588596 RepID=A0A2I1HLL7_9GLOM|nr:hypothetical protein RhiirA4_482759 [Rhizophagus irregularis]
MSGFLNVNNSNDFSKLGIFYEFSKHMYETNLNDKLKMIYSKNEELYLDFPIQNGNKTGRYSPTSRRRTRSNSNLSSHYSGQCGTSFQLDPQVYEL